MTLHPRLFVVQAAEMEMAKAVGDLIERHQLTYVETMQALTNFQQRYLKYMLREERHPNDPDKKGDEAPEPVQDTRASDCVKKWPECRDGEYDPRCCRFPKECSCG